MSIGTLVRCTVAPFALGFGAYAAIVLTAPNLDDLSLTRLLAGFAAWLGVGAAGVFLADRRRPSSPPPEGKGPDCERCGNPTGKPFLYNNPHQHWRCEPCEQEVIDIIFRAASERRLTDTVLRSIHPLPEK